MDVAVSAGEWARQQIAWVAAEMITGQVELLEGCRAIVQLRAELADADDSDPDLHAFIAVESDLDDTPYGAARQLWETNALAEKDRRQSAYLESARDSILSSCHAIVAKWGVPAARMAFPCPCCGFLTLKEKPPGTFAICEVCYWEDDRQQFTNRDLSGGANRVSLREAQENFRRIGASEPAFVNDVRPPLPDEILERK